MWRLCKHFGQDHVLNGTHPSSWLQDVCNRAFDSTQSMKDIEHKMQSLGSFPHPFRISILWDTFWEMPCELQIHWPHRSLSEFSKGNRSTSSLKCLMLEEAALSGLLRIILTPSYSFQAPRVLEIHTEIFLLLTVFGTKVSVLVALSVRMNS